MTDAAKKLLRIIYSEVRESRGSNCWMSRMYIIRESLDLFEPTKPDDGTCNFLAYNVPGKKRMKMKTGRFLTRKLNLNSGFLPDVSIRRITDKINLYLFPDLNIRLDLGEKIRENYGNAVGGSSCMCDEVYVGLYADNPKVYRQLIIEYGNDSARAMVIKLDNGEYLLDRVYSTCSSLIDKMWDYAKEQGWWIREFTGASDYGIVGPNGDEPDYDIFKVSGLDYIEGEVPFQDTLTEYLISGGLSLQHGDCSGSTDGTLDSTDGTIESGYQCTNCGEHVHGEDVRSYDEDTYCQYCYNESFINCEKCYEAFPCDDVVRIEDKQEYWCQYCADNHAYQCEDCNEYFIEGLYTIEPSEKLVCHDCIDHYSYCEGCNEYFGETNDEQFCQYCAEQAKDDEDSEEVSEDVEALDVAGQ